MLKPYKIKMLPLAKIDLTEIVDYLSDFSESVATKQYDKIIEKINDLKQFPFKCVEYKASNLHYKYRRMVVDNYLVFYVVFNEHIEIHRIIHTKRDLSNFPDLDI